jgi:hypothetical protein
MAAEFQKPADAPSAPGAGDLGQSKIEYGKQRNVTAEAGSEGAKYVSVQIGNGGIGSQSKSEEKD